MAWRFKASKYKNAAPIVPKPENCVRDITVGSYQTYGHNIVASAAVMAFNVGQNGSSLAVLPLDDCGRKGKDMALLHGHTDTVTDMSFSPFHDGLLATGSQDCLIKLWNVPATGLEHSLTNPECVLHSKTQRRVETVLFHPIADCLLSTSSFTVLNLWDITTQQCVYNNAETHSEVIQCMCWNMTGTLAATTCKDKQLRVIDCRGGDKCVTHETTGHQGIKDSRVVWLNDGYRLLTTGFNGARQREVFIRDIRKMNQLEKSLELDSSTGILLPLYDPDTNMMFLAGKGDTSIAYMEVSNREPYLIEGLRHNGEQSKGACLVPKRALNVMQGEVNRVLQLTSAMVIPIMYQVPRKTYRDFHADLYPDTPGCVSELTSAQWMAGNNSVIAKISLDPARKPSEGLVLHRGSLQQVSQEIAKRARPATVTVTVKGSEPSACILPSAVKKAECARVVTARPVLEPSNGHNSDVEDGPLTEQPPKPMPRTSRSNSIDQLEDRPVARPRTHKNSAESLPHVVDVETEQDSSSSVPQSHAVIQSVNPNLPVFGGYKPRLGPKPFTPPKLHNHGASLEHVMSVESTSDQRLSPDTEEAPSPPMSMTNEFEKPALLETKNNDLSRLAECNKTYEKSSLGRVCVKSNDLGSGKIDNGLDKPLKKVFNSCNGGEKTQNGDGDGDDDEERDSEARPRTPSMADRRRLFEAGRQGSGDEETEVEVDVVTERESTKDGDCPLDRGSAARSSIAERRRMYENRSVSVPDGPAENKSPTALRRKGSLKKKPEEVAEEPASRRATVCGPVKAEKQNQVQQTPTSKRTSTVFGRVSKFRHLKGTPMHKSMFIENIRNVSRQVSGECDGFHANCERVAVPQSGPGGKIAVLEVRNTGRLPDGVIPTLVHGTTVMDFCWDPFDDSRLAVACDDGMVRLWHIPPEGLTEPTNEPNALLESHTDKIYCIKFHPLAKDVLTTAAYDMSVKLWDLSAMKEKVCLSGHTDQIFSMAWSPCGKLLATVCKDGRVRIYNPRQQTTPLKETKGPVGTRGARLVWALDGSFLVIMGFDKVSERQIIVYKVSELESPLTTVGLDVSPAILMPFYDEDSSTLFLTGRGDSTIYTFEITEEPPYVCPLSHHRCSSLHQGLSFLPKKVCDVAAVEFARALRLSNNTIEPLSFTVPRIKSELFQDDLFPPTRATWQHTMTSAEWFAGTNKPAPRVSLQPDGMESLSSLGQGEKATKSMVVSALNKYHPEVQDFVKAKQNEIQKSVSRRLEVNLSLEQDKMEGVDEREWEE